MRAFLHASILEQRFHQILVLDPHPHKQDSEDFAVGSFLLIFIILEIKIDLNIYFKITSINPII